MTWFLLAVLVLLVPILAIVLDSQLGRALAARLERRDIGSPGGPYAERLAFLENEVERLNAEVRRLDEESRFMNQLLEGRTGERPVLRKGERSD